MEILNPEYCVLSTLWKKFQLAKAIKPHKKKQSSEFGVEELVCRLLTSAPPNTFKYELEQGPSSVLDVFNALVTEWQQTWVLRSG